MGEYAWPAAILGLRFTAARILVSLPLVILGSILIEKILLRSGYRIPEAPQ